MSEHEDCTDRISMCGECYALVWDSYLTDHYIAAHPEEK